MRAAAGSLQCEQGAMQCRQGAAKEEEEDSGAVPRYSPMYGDTTHNASVGGGHEDNFVFTTETPHMILFWNP